MDELDLRIERLEKLAKEGSRGNSSASNINVNMSGSHGVWLCVTLCAMSLLSCLFTLYIVSEVKQNDRDQMHQMNAVYQYAPHLRPKDKP